MTKNKMLLPLNIQYFAEETTFDPNNVMMQDMKTGEIPKEYGTLILQDVQANSVVMQAAVNEPMTKQVKEFSYLANGPGAYWVGEGEKIQTSKAEWLTAKMEAKKLGVILLATREFLQYTMSQFFTEMRPHIAKAFYKKFDEAALLNVSNPFVQSLEQSINDTGKVITGDLNGENILAVIDTVADDDFDVNGFISKTQNRGLLRGANAGTDASPEWLYDRSTNTIDGLPVLDLKSAEMPKGTLYTGDFNQMRYGIPYNLNYELTTTGQISTITDGNGDPINLFEREMIAMRATMDVAFMVTQDEAFAKVEPGEEDPEEEPEA